jgi:hypothetical protein
MHFNKFRAENKKTFFLREGGGYDRIKYDKTRVLLAMVNGSYFVEPDYTGGLKKSQTFSLNFTDITATKKNSIAHN